MHMLIAFGTKSDVDLTLPEVCYDSAFSNLLLKSRGLAWSFVNFVIHLE